MLTRLTCLLANAGLHTQLRADDLRRQAGVQPLHHELVHLQGHTHACMQVPHKRRADQFRP